MDFCYILVFMFIAIKALYIYNYNCFKTKSFCDMKVQDNSKKRVISGVQPTGLVHLGNYLGAIKRFSDYQINDLYEPFFFIANLHSITAGPIPDLYTNSLFLIAVYLACGLDPNKTTIFAQNDIPELTEVCWILSCITPTGWLNRMTQYKSKSEKTGEMMGLYSYPLLMAADILLYQAEIVPVGDDQLQHIELVRNIAERFNFLVKKDVFKLPVAELPKNSPRLMSLCDPDKKMSKSDEKPNSRIHLTDTNDEIVKKISRAVTDSEVIEDYKTMVFKNRLAPINLLSIIAELNGDFIHNVCDQYNGMNYSKVKNDLSDIVINHIAPIRQKILDYMKDTQYLETVLQIGAEKARTTAIQTKKIVYESFGINK